ncbi:MAG TPA: hypothetical protein VFZ06_11040 [Acidimicrobiia bacterium]|nr:hypothetical protein [Acidimicrobiia bacterium]
MSSRHERLLAAQAKLRQSQQRLRPRKRAAGHHLYSNVVRLDRKARDIDRNLRRIIGVAVLDDPSS